MAREVVDYVNRIAEELDKGTDADWAREWHEWECSDFDDTVETLEEHLEECELRPSAYDYLEKALAIDTESDDGPKCRILVTFGGPNIWVNTRTRRVEGYWWMDSHFASFTDTLGLADALEELYPGQ